MRRGSRRILLKLAVVAFALRAVVPVGFMPAPLGAGGPFILCPGGPGGIALQSLLGEHMSHAAGEHEGTTHEAWEHCPVGAALAAIAPASEPSIALPRLEHVLASPYTAIPWRAAPYSAYLARAPPAI